MDTQALSDSWDYFKFGLDNKSLSTIVQLFTILALNYPKVNSQCAEFLKIK